MFHDSLRLRPEAATQLGLDKGADADLRARLAAAAVAKVREQDLTWSRNARRAMSTVTRLRRGELS